MIEVVMEGTDPGIEPEGGECWEGLPFFDPDDPIAVERVGDSLRRTFDLPSPPPIAGGYGREVRSALARLWRRLISR